jgi:endo-1,4-beta-xylanase
VRSPLSSKTVAAAILLILLACGRSPPGITPDASPVTGAGGTLVGMGGTAATTSGSATGGTAWGGGALGADASSGTGGLVGAGGANGSDGRLASGGDTGAGGDAALGWNRDVSSASGRDGMIETGGTLVGRGGSPGSGGLGVDGSVVGSGGASGTAGASGFGGSLTIDGGTGGAGARGGGTSGAGGTTGSGGASASVTFPPKYFGNVDVYRSAGPEIPSDFASYWDQLTPENSGKWASVQGSSGSTFSWSRLDAFYKYCEENGIIFAEKSFVWGSAQPGWINKSNAASAVQNWMRTFCDRYPKTRVIDVVDEPLHTTPGYRDGLGSSTGWEWVANVFKWARDACPNAVLLVNDYNIIEYSSEHGRIIDLVNSILAAGAPVMAIGAQGHDVTKVSLSTLQTYVADLVTQTGLPVYITELDLPVADDNQQATILKDFVTTFWSDPNVRGITYWGYIMGYTWRANTGLMSSSGTMRPAMTWLMDFLGR